MALTCIRLVDWSGQSASKNGRQLKYASSSMNGKGKRRNKIQINFKFENLLDSDVGMGVCFKHVYYYLFSKHWPIKDKITIG